MKKSNITVNAIKNTITVSQSFYKKASTFGTKEYYELREVMSQNAGFKIEFKIIEKKTYAKLTFEVMESYIKTQPNSENQLAKFAAVQRIAKAKNSLYPLTKKWFLSAYPAYKLNEVQDQETAAMLSDTELVAQAAAELEALVA